MDPGADTPAVHGSKEDDPQEHEPTAVPSAENEEGEEEELHILRTNEPEGKADDGDGNEELVVIPNDLNGNRLGIDEGEDLNGRPKKSTSGQHREEKENDAAVNSEAKDTSRPSTAGGRRHSSQSVHDDADINIIERPLSAKPQSRSPPAAAAVPASSEEVVIAPNLIVPNLDHDFDDQHQRRPQSASARNRQQSPTPTATTAHQQQLQQQDAPRVSVSDELVVVSSNGGNAHQLQQELEDQEESRDYDDEDRNEDEDDYYNDDENSGSKSGSRSRGVGGPRQDDDASSSKPYRTQLNAPIYTVGSTQLTYAKAKLYGLLDENGELRKDMLGSKSTASKTFSKQRVVDLSKPRPPVSAEDIDDEEAKELRFKPGRSKEAEAAMRNPRCGYDFVDRLKDRGPGDFLENAGGGKKGNKAKQTEMDIAKKDYDARLDKLQCPSCKMPQSFDEFYEKRRTCARCKERFTKLNVTTGAALERRNKSAEEKRREKLAAVEAEMYAPLQQKFVARRPPPAVTGGTGPSAAASGSGGGGGGSGGGVATATAAASKRMSVSPRNGGYKPMPSSSSSAAKDHGSSSSSSYNNINNGGDGYKKVGAPSSSSSNPIAANTNNAASSTSDAQLARALATVQQQQQGGGGVAAPKVPPPSNRRLSSSNTDSEAKGTAAATAATALRHMEASQLADNRRLTETLVEAKKQQQLGGSGSTGRPPSGRPPVNKSHNKTTTSAVDETAAKFQKLVV